MSLLQWLHCGAISFSLAMNIGMADEFHVSLNGTSKAAGSPQDPFGSLEQAKLHIRALRQDPEWIPTPIRVIVHAGEYRFEQALCFEQQDSGTADAPVIYAAAEGEEVVLSGGASMHPIGNAAQFEEYKSLPQSVRDLVMVYAIDGAHHDTFVTKPRSPDHEMHVGCGELFSNRKACPKAGWPNEGWAINTSETRRELLNSIGTERNDSLWIHAFALENDRDQFVEGKLANDDGIVSLVKSTDGDWAMVEEGTRFRVEGSLSLLDSPGEWFLDESKHRLLWWPGPKDSEMPCLTHCETLLSLYDANFVEFHGFQFEGARCQGIEIVGGERCAVRNCSIRNCGSVGVNVYHGSHHVVIGNTIHGHGASGVRIEGGDRESLVSCEHICERNHIYDCGRSHQTCTPAIGVQGVGCVVRNNEIHNQPDWAIGVFGINHVVALNEIHHVCLQTRDTGAIYMSDDPAHCGNHIESNHIHDVGGFDRRDVVGIYLDNFVSGNHIVGNCIENTPRGIVIGGGVGNEVRNNVIRDCLAGVQLDSRGESWARAGFLEARERVLELKESDSLLWKTFPELDHFASEEAGQARHNQIVSNVIQCDLAIDLHNTDKRCLVVEKNTRQLERLFDGDRLDEFRPDAEDFAESLGLKPILVKHMGRPDEGLVTFVTAPR